MDLDQAEVGSVPTTTALQPDQYPTRISVASQMLYYMNYHKN